MSDNGILKNGVNIKVHTEAIQIIHEQTGFRIHSAFSGVKNLFDMV